jgi:hypothetical protein
MMYFLYLFDNDGLYQVTEVRVSEHSDKARSWRRRSLSLAQRGGRRPQQGSWGDGVLHWHREEEDALRTTEPWTASLLEPLSEPLSEPTLNTITIRTITGTTIRTNPEYPHYQNHSTLNTISEPLNPEHHHYQNHSTLNTITIRTLSRHSE